MSITSNHTSSSQVAPLMDDARTAESVERIFFELRKVIVGQNRLLERLLVGLLARGHCLLESVPGLAKTLAAETLANVVGGTFARIQFTPDLLPSDIVGTRIYRGSTEQFDVELGPVFVNFLLTDEINRAPAKVQSALLEVMQERQVTIGGITHPVPDPFFVVATQNPIESEGVYQLPDAQRDRFMMKVVLGHPSAAEEMVIIDRMAVNPPVPSQVIDLDGLIELQRKADAVFVDRSVAQYAVDLVQATRNPVTFNLGELRAVDRPRRQSPGQPEPGQGRPLDGPHPRPHLRHAAGRVRRGAGGPPPPPAADLRRTGPGHHAGPHRQPHPRDGAGDVGVAEAERRRPAGLRWLPPPPPVRSPGPPVHRPSRSSSSCARSS